MRDLGRRLQDRGRRLWRWLFPPRLELPEEVARLLRTVYPSLDLGAVRFYRGLPHLTRLLGAQAVTLPAPLARRRACVYVDAARLDTVRCEGVGTLLHEAYHALQMQESGWGAGPFRPFLLLYFARGAANRFRYREHPMEEDAYRLAGRRHSRFESSVPGWPAAPPEALAALAVESSGLRFWRDLARSLPFLRRDREEVGLRPAAALLLALPLALWLGAWSLALALAWLGWLLLVGAGAVVAAMVWCLGALLSGSGSSAPREPAL